MIDSIHIKNFKSIVDLTIDLGKFNVIIGENGCGKSNILEAIAFGAASSADKLDYEFLGSRGIRVTNPEFMYSAFSDKQNRTIDLDFTINDDYFKNYNFKLTNDNNNSKKWINKNKDIDGKRTKEVLKSLIFEKDKFNIPNSNLDTENLKKLEDLGQKINSLVSKSSDESENKKFFDYIFNKFLEDQNSSESISNFIIYSPEQSSLRKFEDTTQIYPLGIRGEGLFQYLKELSFDKKSKKIFNEIKKNMILLDWYENFDLSESLLKNEHSLQIKDRYINENLNYFDQRSTNEGFLYLLFYSTLFLSKITPKFFAIDNIDASFNPKLCMQMTKSLYDLSKKSDKQVILTTHNPAILDGLDLKDNNQRLFVVRRNENGETKIKRIEYKKDREMKLSEIWTSGFIGGLPENF
ncbi:AAA family ATPase [Flavobacterium psychrophilum]|uniref:AAA family ATPase n=1 Tax=Flavobacterium psychrophilum TaxID=96345 RepID=UPI0029F64A06|nr:AAA family ATPase [Flavobacterium psychrophilum]EKT4553237.1 AAA family ATPase [Flavobacterium psychrophilum]